MPEVPDRTHRTGAFWLDMLVALAAVCISIASLWVALREDRTQEHLLAASVWPVLLFETSNYAETANPEQTRHIVRFTITNAGVGPAKVKWFDVYYLGKTMRDGNQFLLRCCERRGQHGLRYALISNYLQGRVLAARESVHFLDVPRSATNAAEFTVLDRERLKVYVRACYCSVLDECWLLDSRQKEPTAMHDCPTADMPLYQG